MIDIFRGEVNIRACLFKMCMEKFMIEYPSIMRETDAIDYVNEFKRYNSSINGIARLDRYLDDYDSWICYLESEKVIKPNEKTVPTVTYFIVRKNDNRIVGMINIRLAMNERVRKSYGTVGYSIRPTERGKGYGKLSLFFGVLVCNCLGIKKIYLECDKDNYASAKIITDLGGIFKCGKLNEKTGKIESFYNIDTQKSFHKYSDIYCSMVDNIPQNFFMGVVNEK